MKTIHFASMDSTNSYGKGLIGTESFKHGTVITAGRQSAGRGRSGKSFASEGGLYMSLLLDARYPDYFITIAAAVATRSAIQDLCGINCNIKWVNDLFYQNKKICGILTETKLIDGVPAGFVCGIGINTKNTNLPEELKAVAGCIPWDNNTALAEKIAENLLYLYENNINPIGAYRDGLMLNMEVDVYKGKTFQFSGTAVNINEQGNLIVSEAGKLHTLNSGEISIKL